jgi:hypothetical protein
LACFLAVSGVGCAGDPENMDRGADAPSAGDMTSTPAVQGSAGTGNAFGNSNGHTAPTTPQIGDGTPPGTGVDGGECGATSLAAKQVVVETEVTVETPITEIKPVALYLMLDQSASMGLGDLWDPAVSALKSFMNDGASTGLDVGIQYFPGAGSCSDGSGYSTPEVAMGKLPDHAQTMIASLDQHDPNGIGTPIEGALRGVTEFCKQFQAADSDEKCVAVLVTDGKPELSLGCESNSTNLANIAGAAHTAGVTTFAVGLHGADFSLLDQIAMQGGAPDCDSGSAYACDVSGGADKLLDALAKIRDTVTVIETHKKLEKHVEGMPLACEWEIPTPPDGESFDRTKVNVQLTAAGTDIAFGMVSAASSCVPKGWHYDDPTSPARIIACPETCDLIQSTAEAKIQILLGCAAAVLD